MTEFACKLDLDWQFFKLLNVDAVRLLTRLIDVVTRRGGFLYSHYHCAQRQMYVTTATMQVNNQRTGRIVCKASERNKYADCAAHEPLHAISDEFASVTVLI